MSEAVLLVDLSSIAYPIWHMSASDADPNAASTKIVARVRALAASHPHAAICADSGRSFRADIDPTYKANRPQAEEALHHQIRLAREILENDGFPVWAVRGFEADDLIAAAATTALARGLDVVIATADKDLCQLVNQRVKVWHPKDGAVVDEDAVFAKFGVLPHQMGDYLSLCGDASDNIKGAKGIGPKRAAELLCLYGSLASLCAAIDSGEARLNPAVSASLAEFRPRMETVRSLVAMRTDAPIEFDQALAERTPKDAQDFTFQEDEMEEPVTQETNDAPQQAAEASAPAPEAPKPTNGNGQAVAKIHEADLIATPPAEWERQLDPRSPKEARILAADMHQSRMFSAYGSPQAVLATIMVGRELGLPALASLRAIHNVEGRHTLSAGLMVALVLKSGLAEFFDPVEFDEVHATFETKRRGARKAISLTHTIDMARTAGLVKPKSNWETVPVDMLMARAQARLARLVYADLVFGLYTPEELQEIRERSAA